MADFVCYLLSERASYITGVTLTLRAAKRAAKEALWSTPFLCPRQISLRHAGIGSDGLRQPNVEAVEFVPGENAGDIVAKWKS